VNVPARDALDVAPARAVAICTALALAGFAANSLLCRQALLASDLTPAAFTAWRLASGAAVLALIVLLRPARGASADGGGDGRGAHGGVHRRVALGGGDWRGALALFVYAIAFAQAYVVLDAGLGALLLFGAVQLTMLLAARLRGERFGAAQWTGIALAALGLVALKLPLGGAPPAWSATLAMLLAGAAWGVYSLLGRSARSPLQHTAGNFLRAAPLAVLFACFDPQAVPMTFAPIPHSFDGVGYAIASGALASGLGYALWYAALPALRTATAALLQLLVPVLAALGGVALLGESLDARLLIGGAAILGGVALALWPRAAR